jgi:hypothetical protein
VPVLATAFEPELALVVCASVAAFVLVPGDDTGRKVIQSQDSEDSSGKSNAEHLPTTRGTNLRERRVDWTALSATCDAVMVAPRLVQPLGGVASTVDARHG